MSTPTPESNPPTSLDAVDPRLLAELRFADGLGRPAPWLQALLGLGEVVNGLLPLMTDWMSRWSSALSYDASEAPLVHARWAAPIVEASEVAPPIAQARPAPAATQHSTRVVQHMAQRSERVVSHTAERSVITKRSVTTERSVTRVVERTIDRAEATRPVVQATAAADGPPPTAAGEPSRPGAGDRPSALTHDVPAPPVAADGIPAPADAGSTARAAAPVVAPSADPPVAPTPARPVAAGQATPRGLISGVAPAGVDMPSMPALGHSAPRTSVTRTAVTDMPSGQPSESSRMPSGPSDMASESSVEPSESSRMPSMPSDATSAPATAAGRSSPAPAAPFRIHPEGEQALDIAALQAAVDAGARVISRGVRRGLPDAVVGRGSPAPAAVSRIHPSPPDAPDASAQRPVVLARRVSGGPTTATRPVTRATAGSGPNPVARVRGASAPMPAAVNASHGISPPAPGPVPATPAVAPGPRFVPVGPPGSPAELARMLGRPAPPRSVAGAAPGAPPGAAQAPTPAPIPGQPVVLDPGQIKTIAGVVQQQVIRQIEQERARTRTRV